MTLTNKAIEMWKCFNKIKKKDMISIDNIEKLEMKIADAFAREEDRRKELIKSRDNWKEKYLRLKNEKKF